MSILVKYLFLSTLWESIVTLIPNFCLKITNLQILVEVVETPTSKTYCIGMAKMSNLFRLKHALTHDWGERIDRYEVPLYVLFHKQTINDLLK